MGILAKMDEKPGIIVIENVNSFNSRKDTALEHITQEVEQIYQRKGQILTVAEPRTADVARFINKKGIYRGIVRITYFGQKRERDDTFDPPQWFDVHKMSIFFSMGRSTEPIYHRKVMSMNERDTILKALGYEEMEAY